MRRPAPRTCPTPRRSLLRPLIVPGRSSCCRPATAARVTRSVPAHDDLARERLCRYLARPAFSLARLGVRRDGLVVYRVKNAGCGRVKPRVMSPVECLARLAAMVPSPRYPLLRLHGVLAARPPWRARVVPRQPESQAGCSSSSSKKEKSTSSVAAAKAEPGPPSSRASSGRGWGRPRSVRRARRRSSRPLRLCRRRRSS